MCNLYSMTRSRDEVRRWLGVSDNRAAGAILAKVTQMT